MPEAAEHSWGMKKSLPPHPAQFQPSEVVVTALDEKAIRCIAEREMTFAEAAGISAEQLGRLWDLATGLAGAGHHDQAASIFGGLAWMFGPTAEVDLALAGCFASLGDRALALSHLNAATDDGRPEIRAALLAVAEDLGFELGPEGRWH